MGTSWLVGGSPKRVQEEGAAFCAAFFTNIACFIYNNYHDKREFL